MRGFDMGLQFKVIGIYGRVKNPGVMETLKALIHYLRSLDLEIRIDSDTAELLEDASLVCFQRDELCRHCDLLIVVGGDGSLLHAAHSIINDGIPVLGINRGRLGFLTDILPSNLKKIKAILEGDYILEKRFLLTATVEHAGKILGEGNALNEVALIPDSVPHMNEFEIYINDQFVCSQDSDGVIVATPTGSTAYALSGGGPILHPQLDALVLVPMFPHTLSLRPIVIEGSHRITIVITPNNTATPRLTCDSQSLINTPPGSRIHIQKKNQHLHLIHPLDYDYYETLRSKLHWGRKLHYAE
ncbi:NAD kinase [Aquicella siphonis]|uniref:NAD kinase n=1 Tax=Aquicella siphonis TaxID=254247 RepID=A0A5E4PIH7_9COXI|nr:NAD(+) kinase [Aquicella siphonis]VVC76375.1 NAD kinase [Aquicella siphonis]